MNRLRSEWTKSGILSAIGSDGGMDVSPFFVRAGTIAAINICQFAVDAIEVQRARRGQFFAVSAMNLVKKAVFLLKGQQTYCIGQ